MDISEAAIDLRVPPLASNSRIVRDRVEEFGRAHGVGDDDLSYFLIALGEALANAIEHGLGGAEVEIEVRLGRDRIVATVQDGGVGFTGDAIADASLPETTSERGRGVPIMRRCCEIFAVTAVPGKGTAVVLGRYLRTPAEAVA